MKDNPYVGPRPYGREDRRNFYGRDREARELRALIVAEREVLFYAQSGAGKTSLLNTMVIPALEEKGFDVLPVARVGSDLPPRIEAEAVDNVFVFSALLGLAGENVTPQALLHHTLRSFLGEFYPEPEDQFESRPLVLILDQFEEILTTHRDRWQDARGFFLQVRDALDALPRLGVVFAMREDYVAGMDAYTSLFPRRLRARFRMERLGAKGALAAVTKPALNAGCPFDPGVAERLVDDLRRTRVQQHAGSSKEPGEGTVVGPFVEPVQLQVVCHRLWANLPEQEDNAIQWDEVKKYGDIDRALTDFYENTLDTAMRETDVSERVLRRWFGQQLITSVGTRGLAMQGPEETAGLPNAAVDVLEGLHLIRADVRAGARWYELSHDRLVDPIVQSNQAWEAKRETPLRAAARRWKDTGNIAMLYRDTALKEALAWARTNPEDVELYEAEFLEASQQAQQIRARTQRVRTMGIIGLVVSLVLMAVLTFWALNERTEVQKQRQAAVARQLIAQARITWDNTGTGLVQSALLAAESLRWTPTLEGSDTLRRGLALLHRPVARMQHDQSVWAVAFSPDGRRVASAGGDGTVRVWDAVTGQEVAQVMHEAWAETMAFSPDGRWVVSGSGDGTMIVWEADTGEEVARMEHAGGVWAVAFSPDGRWVASGSRDDTARVWEAATGEEVTRVEHGGWVEAVAFSPDGRWVASGSGDYTVRVWEAATGEEVARMKHDGWVWAVDFSPDGRWVASGSGDYTARVWEAATGKEIVRVEHKGWVETVAFSPDGQWVASDDGKTAVRVWEAATGKDVARMEHAGHVQAVAFSSDGQRIASGSKDGTARVWEIFTQEEIARTVHAGEVHAVAFSPDNQWVVSGSEDGAVWVWPATTGAEMARMEHEGLVEAVAFSPDGQWVASGGWDKTVRVWEAATGEEVARTEHQWAVLAVAFSPGGRRIVSGSGDPYYGTGEGEARVWDATTGEEIARTTHERWVKAVAFSPDGQWVASGSGDGAVRVWETVTGAEIAQMEHDDDVNAVAFSPDGQWVVSASDDRTARVWNAATGEEVTRMEHADWVRAVAFSPDGRWVASGSGGRTGLGQVRVWEAATGEEVVRMEHDDDVIAVAFSPDGKWVASGSFDRTARIWEAATGQEISQVAHEDVVNAVAFSPDGQWVASASGDGALQVSETATGATVARAQHEKYGLQAVAFSPDGRWIVAGSGDPSYGETGDARVWVWRSDDWIAEACARLPRNLTQEEWEEYLQDESYHLTCPDLPAPGETELPAIVEVRVGNAPPEGNSEARQTLEAQVELFEKSHPNVKIILDTWTWNPQEFAVSLAGGQVPDIIAVPATEGYILVDQGYAADITNLMHEWAIGEDFNDAILAPYQRDERIYAVPVHGYAMGLFYDKKLFRDAGLVDSSGEPVPPTTWNEFVEAARAVKERTDAAGFCIFTQSNQGGWTFINWGWQAGGEFERYEDGQWKAVFDEQPVVDALQFVKDLRWKHDVLQDALLLDAGQSFPLAALHQCGMAIYAPEWFDIIVNQYDGDLDDLGMTILPQGPGGRANLMGGVYHVIVTPAAQTAPEVREAAFNWIAWSVFDFEALENTLKLRRETGALVGLPWIPKFKPESETGRREQELIDEYRNVPYYQTYVEEAGEYVRPEPPVATNDLYAILDTVIQTVLTDENADPQALLTQAVEEFQAQHLDILGK